MFFAVEWNFPAIESTVSPGLTTYTGPRETMLPAFSSFCGSAGRYELTFQRRRQLDCEKSCGRTRSVSPRLDNHITNHHHNHTQEITRCGQDEIGKDRWESQ